MAVKNPGLELQLVADSPDPSSRAEIGSDGSDNKIDMDDDSFGKSSPKGEDPKYEIKWVKYILILGKPPPLTARQWNVFGLLSLAGMMTTYDDTLKSVGLEQIQESLDISDSDVSYVIAIIRMGVLLAIFLSLAADKMGRRPLLLTTIMGFAVMSAITAAAMNVVWFTVCQFFAKMFLHTEYMLSNVSILEEFDTGTRGWAVGAISALCVIGSGLCIIIYGPVGSYSYGWRILYAIGVVPLLVLAYMRRKLPETRMFLKSKDDAAKNAVSGEDNMNQTSWQKVKSFFSPLQKLEGHHLRLANACLLLFVRGFCGFPAEFFMFKVLQEKFGYTTLEVTAITIGGGMVSIFAYVSAGKLSDWAGRRPVLSVVYATYFTFLILFYNSPGGALTVIFWILFAASMFGLDVLNSALVSEVFPTKARATASTISVIVGVVGTIVGIIVEGAIYGTTRSHWSATTYVAIPGFSCIGLVWLLPESAFENLIEE